MKLKQTLKAFLPTDKFSIGFYAGLLMAIVLPIIGYQFINQSKAYFEPLVKPKVKTISMVEYVEIPAEPTMKEWVLNTVKEAGLDPNAIDCLIQHESGWDNWKYGINTNRTTDMGLWQINSIHKKTASVECRFDYKCATYWAIEKIKNDGNMNAWYGYLHNCK